MRSGVVGEIDLYLIALVLYIFSFGIYELFISEIEGLKQSKQSPRNALARRTQG
ncbi:YqhA family protein [Campylobacter rectus]|uniref:YqhA family protein n=1 Tax=Campylobacter rectus TaxID=203 RepID=UPI00030BB09E|nr:YqhA family protein [Campylobacter rectus]